ncbi:MAG: hypothetical protein NVSMB17_13170 [Candidatus Dormibacteria bacterium]
MISTVAAKALIAASALAALGSTTALAATPGAAPSIQKSATATTQPAHKKHADTRQGVVIKLSDTEMTIEREVRDKTTRAVHKDDTTFVLNDATRVYRAGSKDPVGRGALKVGERVRVAFTDKDGKKVARRVVIERDVRAGKVVARGNDYFVIHTREHGDVRINITDKTRFTTGHGKDKKDGSFAAMKVGDRAVARGEEDAQHNLNAVTVHYTDAPAHQAKTPARPN